MTEPGGQGQPRRPAAPAWAGRRHVEQQQGRAAARAGWDADAARYQSDHGAFLAGPGPDGDVVWCPEGWLESEVSLLGPAHALAGTRVLDLGCGAGQAARWLATQVAESAGGWVVGVDVSGEQLAYGAAWQREHPERPPVILLHADAHELPLAADSVDVVVSAFGVLAFVPDLSPVMTEIARVLHPDGHATLSLPHPVRWMFPDDPTVGDGMQVTTSYFDRTPYVEIAADGSVTYAEYHHTLQDLVVACTAAGLVIEKLWEPSWRGDRARTFGGWSAPTVDLVPKTLIVRLGHR